MTFMLPDWVEDKVWSLYGMESTMTMTMPRWLANDEAVSLHWPDPKIMVVIVITRPSEQVIQIAGKSREHAAIATIGSDAEPLFISKVLQVVSFLFGLERTK